MWFAIAKIEHMQISVNSQPQCCDTHWQVGLLEEQQPIKGSELSLGDWKAAWSCSSNLEKYIFWSCGREASALQGTTVLLTVLVNWSCLTKYYTGC